MLFVFLERAGPTGLPWHATGTNGDVTDARSSKSMIDGTTGDTGRRAPYNPNPAYADGRMLSTYDVENMLITFMAAISGMLILFLIVIIMIRVHYKARAEEIVHEMETQHQTRKQKTPSPFAVPPRRELEEEEDYVPVGKVRDGQHALYWRGDQVAAIVHHAALAPVIPSFEPVEGNVEIADYRRIR